MITKWTASMVEERLEEAASTLRRLPPVKVTGYFNVWPHIMHDADDKKDWETEIRRLGPPSPAAISRMEETIMWFRWLSAEENKLVWDRAAGKSWKTLCRSFGCGRTTIWRHWVYALSAIAFELNTLSSKEQNQGELLI